MRRSYVFAFRDEDGVEGFINVNHLVKAYKNVRVYDGDPTVYSLIMIMSNGHHYDAPAKDENALDTMYDRLRNKLIEHR